MTSWLSDLGEFRKKFFTLKFFDLEYVCDNIQEKKLRLGNLLDCCAVFPAYLAIGCKIEIFEWKKKYLNEAAKEIEYENENIKWK